MANLNQHSILLHEINRHTNLINADKLVLPDNVPDFPLKTNEDFKKFDKEILSDTSVKDYMVSN